MRSMSLVVDLIDLVTKHKSGELRCPATALIIQTILFHYVHFFHLKIFYAKFITSISRFFLLFVVYENS